MGGCSSEGRAGLSSLVHVEVSFSKILYTNIVYINTVVHIQMKKKPFLIEFDMKVKHFSELKISRSY